jgi:hypothetical protein
MSQGRSAENRATDRERIAALSGRLSAVSLFDLCQFLMLNRKTGNLTVRSDGSAAYLVFLDGQLISAADDNRLDGEGVVLRAVQWEEGTFEFVPGPVPPDRRIQSSTENILLEAARRIDEMQEADGRSDGAAGATENAFREKQVRGASIVEAFRSAVADAELTRSGAGWKGSVLRRLVEPSGERLMLGPGARVGIVAGGSSEELSGIPAQEVRAWMDELAPPPAPGVRRTGTGFPRPVRQEDGSVLWAVRLQSPGGDWVAASAMRPCFPEWSDLGLPDADFDELERRNSGLCLLLGGRAKGGHHSPARDGLAAWLHRRSQLRSECGIVVEDFPRYDWSSLAGVWREFPASWARRDGRLESVIRASGARTIVWIGDCPGAVLAELLELASSGALVVLVEEETELDDWLRQAARRLRSDSLAWCLPDGEPGIAWRLGAGAAPSGLPLRSEFVPITGVQRYFSLQNPS